VAFGAAWVGDVVNSCEVLEYGGWARATGVDHLVYCFERRLGGYAQEGYFPTRWTVPSSWSSPVSPPLGWSAEAVKVVWQQNLYLNGPPPSPPSMPIVSIDGPRQVPQWQTCAFHGSASGGTEPYAFTWLVNGNVEQEGSDWFDWGSGENYTLMLIVTDARGQQGNFTLYITVSSWMQSCEDQ